MPRILFLSIHHRGHINPVKQLARELLRRGESHVSFATYDVGASTVSKDAMCGSLPVCRYEFISAGDLVTHDLSLHRRLRRHVHQRMGA